MESNIKNNKFEFNEMPTYELIFKVPFVILFFGFLFIGIAKVGGLYVSIVLILVLAKIIHFIYTKTNKKVCFNEDNMELVHLNGKSTLIDLKTIAGITARKFTFYQIHDTNIIHYKKDALFKRNVTFHIPSDEFESFQNYLKENSIKYKQIR